VGDIADTMLNGDMCEWCGVYIGEGNGYPRLCKKCQNTPEGRERMKNRSDR